MLAGVSVKVQLALLKQTLPVVAAESVQCLDGVGDVSVDVEGSVDDSIGADAEDTGKLKTIRQQMSKSILGCADAGKEWR